MSILAKPTGRVRPNHNLAFCRGLCATYLFNEKGGTKAYDSIGRFGDLTLVTGGSSLPEWSTHGVTVGNSKGYMENVRTLISPFNPASDDITLRAIIRPRTWPNTYTAIIDTSTNGGSGRGLCVFGNGNRFTYVGVGGQDTYVAGSSEPMLAGEISDFVLVRKFNDTLFGGFSVHYWYIDGKLVLAEPGTVGIQWATNGHYFSVGGNPTGGGAPFDGEYIKVQVWNRALRPTEVAWAYEHPFGEFRSHNQAKYGTEATTVFYIVIDNNFSFSTAMNRLANASRSIADNTGLTDGVTASLLSFINRVVIESLGTQANASRTVSSFRAVLDNFGMTDEVLDSINVFRRVIDNLGLTTSATLIIQHFRSVFDSFGITDHLSAFAAIAILIVDALGQFDQVSRQAVFNKAIFTSLGVSDSHSVMSEFRRIISDNLGSVDQDFLDVVSGALVAGLFADPAFGRLIDGAL